MRRRHSFIYGPELKCTNFMELDFPGRNTIVIHGAESDSYL
jgi:hypothetical protein